MRLSRLALRLPIALIVPVLMVPIFSAPKAYGAEIEEIIVTARKREENLQEVPLSITAFSAQEIERAAFADLEDISMFTPGLQMNSELSGTRPGRLFSNMRFRGVTGAQFAALQTASLFIDGIYALQSAQSVALVDLERVEIIKGPQSAVFGRNSFAGAVNYVTRTPNLEEFQSSVLLDMAQHDNYEASLSFEGPLVEDKLAFRVGVRSFRKGSMYTASDGGALGEQTSNSIFATLYGEPTENFTFRFRAYYQEDDDGPSAVGLYRDGDFFPENDSCTGTSYMGFDGDGNFTELFPSDYLCGEIPDPGVSGAGNGTAPPIDSNTSLRPNFPAFAPPNENFLIDNLLNAGRVEGVPSMSGFGIKREITRISLMGEYTFSNDITLTGTLAWNENVAGNIRDFDLTPVESWWVTNPQAGEDKSADIRVASAGDKRLRWMAGVNYYEQEWLTSDNAGVLAHSCANFAAFDPDLPPSGPCDFPGIFPVGLDGGDTVEQSSVYANLAFDITDKWTIDLEARYQEDTRGDGVSPTKVTYYSVIPRLTLSFRPTENVMMYALATEGVLPGVFNSNFANCGTIPDVNVPVVPYTVSFTDPNTGLQSTSSVCDQYREQVGVGAADFTEQQVLEAFEFGFRTSWADGRVLANVSIYTQKWTEQPSTRGVTAFLDNNGPPEFPNETPADGVPNLNPNFFSVVVAGDSEYSGVELETAFVPTDDWTINFNLSYNDNEFLEFFTGSGGGAGSRCGTTNLRGKRNTRFPEWSGSLSSTYTWQMSGAWSTYVRGDLSYTGETHPDSCNLATSQDYYLLNARVGMESEDIRVELYVKNLTDEETWRAASNFGDFSFAGNGFAPLSGAGIVLIPQDIRTVGVRVTYDF